MKVALIGSGGREHALGWKIVNEDKHNEVFFLPGNGGTCEIGHNVDISPQDVQAISDFVRKASPDLIIVGPEDPLAMGVVDTLTDLGFAAFGPTAACARIESSKAFAKQLMSKYSIPTARYRVFTSESQAHKYIDHSKRPLVVKADGLARGKGSIVTKNGGEAHRAVEMMMAEKAFGPAGDKVVIEDRLAGEEASVLAITDGESYILLPPSQDHKAAFDGDRGPNTGGMGAYCPAPVVDSGTLAHIEEVILKRLLRGLRTEGYQYRGVIYAGLMLNDDGVFVIEFNARFGDPETQCMLPVIDDNLGSLLLQATRGNLGKSRTIEYKRWAVCAVMASGGYPREYEKGKEITGLGEASTRKDVLVFHAGTKRVDDGRLVTSGGRVLGVTGTGKTLREARRRTYEASRLISFEAMHMRTDIGLKGLQRLEKAEVM